MAAPAAEYTRVKPTRTSHGGALGRDALVAAKFENSDSKTARARRFGLKRCLLPPLPHPLVLFRVAAARFVRAARATSTHARRTPPSGRSSWHGVARPRAAAARAIVIPAGSCTSTSCTTRTEATTRTAMAAARSLARRATCQWRRLRRSSYTSLPPLRPRPRRDRFLRRACIRLEGRTIYSSHGSSLRGAQAR